MFMYLCVCVCVCVSQDSEPAQVLEECCQEREECIAALLARVQQLEQENTDFLSALEDAMEQYKQQVCRRHCRSNCISTTTIPISTHGSPQLKEDKRARRQS